MIFTARSRIRRNATHIRSPHHVSINCQRTFQTLPSRGRCLKYCVAALLLVGAAFLPFYPVDAAIIPQFKGIHWTAYRFDGQICGREINQPDRFPCFYIPSLQKGRGNGERSFFLFCPVACKQHKLGENIPISHSVEFKRLTFPRAGIDRTLFRQINIDTSNGYSNLPVVNSRKHSRRYEVSVFNLRHSAGKVAWKRLMHEVPIIHNFIRPQVRHVADIPLSRKVLGADYAFSGLNVIPLQRAGNVWAILRLPAVANTTLLWIAEILQ
jgi:hypothetical protein